MSIYLTIDEHTLTLDRDDLVAMSNGLYVAADLYMRDAAIAGENNRELRARFRAQAVAVERLAHQIEDLTMPREPWRVVHRK